MRIDPAAISTTMSVPVEAAALTTAPVAVSMTRKSRAVAARAMSVRKTRCMTVRKQRARFA
jgi:hypothetical protein